MRTGTFILLLCAFVSCNRLERTTARGQVINWGNKKPIEGARVMLMDGPAGSLYERQLETGHAAEVYSDGDGRFELSNKSEWGAMIGARKDGYTFDGDYSDGAQVGLKGLGAGLQDELVLELQSWSNFNPLFQKKENAQSTDSLYITLGSWTRPFILIEFNDKPYVGKGPFYYGRSVNRKGPLLVADVYVLYKIKQKLNNAWVERIDSVFVPGLQPYTGTIYY